MKKIFLITSLLTLFTFTNIEAQENANTINKKEITAKGKWLIETNTGFGGTFGKASNTGFGLTSFNGNTVWSLGGEAGYFLTNKLALKLGLGYSYSKSFKVFAYKLGAKYYIINQIPIQIDVTGVKASGESENPLWLGLQGGYVFFLTKNIGIEPGVRYNFSLNDDFTNKGIFEFRVGFSLYF